ncbi:MAG: PIG-L family deacetylase [Spirochaetales bacterium]|nr:PIG-L family deacetylase [Spirochaetales bacterium]
MRKILCIGSHPDDVELAMGGTVASLSARNYKVLLLDLSNGEPTPSGSVAIRMQEAAEAARILGVQRKTLTLPNRYIEDTVDNRMLLAAEIRAFAPDTIFAPYALDAHPDHIAASALIGAARFYAKLSKTRLPHDRHFTERLIYYFPVHLRIHLQPSFLQNISAYQEQKKQALLSYQSQFGERRILLEKLLKENEHWGFLSGVDAAEPFFQHEPVLFSAWPEGVP